MSKDVTDGLIAENTALKAERDALVARNHELIGLVLRMRDRWWPFVHGSVAPSQAAYRLGKESADIISKTPRQCLLDVQADAIQAGLDAIGAPVTKFANKSDDFLSGFTFCAELLRQHAAKVRQGGAE